MSLENLLLKVQEFQEAFQDYKEANPNISHEEEYNLRYKLMCEETDEYLEACKQKDIVEIADALADQLYILLGTINTHGLQHIIEDLFNEVHRSNMSKLGADGKPIRREDGKVLKGPGYSEPDLESILMSAKK